MPVYAQQFQTLRDRAQAEIDRIKVLVADGTLPPAALEEAQRRLDDLQDQQTLAETLYNPTILQSVTPEQADAMIAAAARRVDREQKLLEERQKLLDMGIISLMEMGTVRNELSLRQSVLQWARDRVRLMNDLREMAAEEKRLEAATVSTSMIRFKGSGDFKIDELPAIERDFKNHFHHDLPVSAVGETLVHQNLGLDHRNKVDVALNPEQPEGLWLRHYLEKLQIPYLAFRNAVAGAATGAHIHIGTGSSLLSATRQQ